MEIKEPTDGKGRVKNERKGKQTAVNMKKRENANEYV